MMLQENETGVVEWYMGPYTLSTDRARIDLNHVYRFLAEDSYWARDVSKDFIVRSAYLLDVYVDQAHRGLGLGTWLAQVIQTHPDLKSVTRWLLTTIDAHAVYGNAGFKPIAHPEWLMEVVLPMPEDGAELRSAHAENRK
ncbi:GNAT family N-acetyltransferase [Hoeflea prorocentri]|uniref:GNAT family N-acetyltransferase n=1 Tax=Hoeflea prorocentri TaxID=1922333 RepID=A0A9X3UDN5_9HYPH|nr:GNAT family N-acetyltransferase [Hoeflea prorocentri]MCY6379381.1 GNAT family N-acetyltransferase [Hoeflea prorocentri]MDA5397182.1 GNAT family N-acetyltransferase [Hoeflea prorocentri]